jgi:hypothetical protein
MDPRQDDSAPAGSSDASGTLYRAAHDDSGNARETDAAADSTTAARSSTSTIYKIPTETARLRQDVVFRVGARLSKIKREELEIASPAVDGNVLRFIRSFEQYTKEIRPDCTKEEVIELFHFFLRYCELCASPGIADICSAHNSTESFIRIRGSGEACRRRICTFAPYQSSCARQGRVRNSCMMCFAKNEQRIPVSCAVKDETSVDIMGRMFCCNFLRKSRL